MRPRYEVAQIARAYGSDLAERLSSEQKAVLRAITACRTAELGGHLQRCADCGHEQPQYNSCRNRHCPKCQALAQLRWLEARKERILPVHHFHVVFTVPAELRPLMLKNRRLLYALLFETAPQALLAFGIDSKRLGAELGVTAVLHTWARDLGYHPHLHCVVTGGGLSAAGDSWVATRPGYLFPVRALAALFRGKFLSALRDLAKAGRLDLSGSCTALQGPDALEQLLDSLYRKRWNVYCKPPFGDTAAVFAYLGRYTHRVGISNARITHVDDRCVIFNTRHGKRATVSPQEFLRRFLLHVLPKGFVRIRHFGLLASGNVHGRLETARQKLRDGASQTQPHPSTDTAQQRSLSDSIPQYVALYRRLTGIDLLRCPSCGGHATSRYPLELRPRGPP